MDMYSDTFTMEINFVVIAHCPVPINGCGLPVPIWYEKTPLLKKKKNVDKED
jgi:hypothetical protein